MTLSINTNLSSLYAQRQLSLSQSGLEQAMERLSSGDRINSASDDAAGLQISNLLTSQVRGVIQAVRNANDGISFLQTADGALSESVNILQRMRELAIQSASGTYTDANRLTLDAEFKQLSAELDRIATTTKFNGLNVLDGSQKSITLQVGAFTGETLEFTTADASAAKLGLSNTDGTLISNEIDINSETGKLRSDLSYAIKINSQDLGAIAAETSVADLMAKINSKIDGVSVTSLVDLTAETVGDGLLTGANSLTLKIFDLAGNEQSHTIKDTTSLQQLADKINEQVGILSAFIDDDGKLNLTSTKIASLSVQDSTGGTASGIASSSFDDVRVSNIIDGLQNFWMSEAEQRITTYFGLNGNTNVDFELNLYTEEPFGRLASVSWSSADLDADGQATKLNLNIDLADYGDVLMPDGDNGGLFSLDRVIAHEMVHAFMAVNIDLASSPDNGEALPGWFTEGVAEMIHGADDRVVAEKSFIDTESEFQTLFGVTQNHGSPQEAGGYSVAYLAARMLNDAITTKDGTKSIGDVLTYLAADRNNTLSGAIATYTDWGNTAAFETFFNANGFEYYDEVSTGNTTFSDASYAGTITSTLDLGLDDTGSIFGGDISGDDNDNLNAQNVYPNNASSGPSTAFNFIIPDDYSGNYFIADAKLVFNSENGNPIEISTASKGTTEDLKSLGLMTIQTDTSMVSGATLSENGVNSALTANSLSINGVAIDAVEANSGLLAKVEAINSVTSETKVVASAVAIEELSLNTDVIKSFESTSANVGTAGGVLTVNGYEVLPSTSPVAASGAANYLASYINATTANHGVLAYADSDGRLQLFSESAINLGGNVGDNLALTNTSTATTGSVVINNEAIIISDITSSTSIVSAINDASSNTGVTARINDAGKLELKAQTAINIGLGDDNGMSTLNRLGLSIGYGTSKDLGDDNLNANFTDDIHSISLTRIELRAINETGIEVEADASAIYATGLTSISTSGPEGSGRSINTENIQTSASAQRAIVTIDEAIDYVTNLRSSIGSVMNRLDFSVSNLINISENLTSARSRIMDADYAKEAAQLARTQILQRASTAMLAQANQSASQVVSLLR